MRAGSSFRVFGRTLDGLSKGSAFLYLPIIATSVLVIHRRERSTHNAPYEAFIHSAPIGPSVGRITSGSYLAVRSPGTGAKNNSIVGNPESLSGQVVASSISEQKSPNQPLFEGVVLQDKDGNDIDPASLKGKSVALYFAASWCPACRFRSLKLKQWYDRVKEETAGKIEIVLISSDMDAKAVSTHMSLHDWLALPVDHPATRAIKKRYRCWAPRENAVLSDDGVKRESGLPTVIIVDPQGKALERINLEEDGLSGLNKWRYNDWTW